MNTDNQLNWQPVRAIPRTPGTRITVKTEDGDLMNVTVSRLGTIAVDLLTLKGWIPNEQ